MTQATLEKIAQLEADVARYEAEVAEDRARASSSLTSISEEDFWLCVAGLTFLIERKDKPDTVEAIKAFRDDLIAARDYAVFESFERIPYELTEPESELLQASVAILRDQPVPDFGQSH